jgi:regulator of RNase E activity RraA
MSLSNEQLEELKQFDAPTISNAIESFDIRSRAAGFMSPKIRCILPYDKPMIGYACTAKMSALQPPTAEQSSLMRLFFEELGAAPAPSIAVIQDLDPDPVGSLWGEVNASSAKVLGCVGVVTNGGVRDLKEVEELEFGYFASCVLVSHAYDHLETVGGPVEVGGLTVHPGDLVFTDRHGVIQIPHDVAPKLADACRHAIWAEEPVTLNCRKRFGQEVTVEELWKWREEMARRRSRKQISGSAS